MKIYILMPTYNDCESIIETFNSILIQTYKNWNLIVIDDGSTDNTKNVVTKYIDDNKLSEKFTYLYQENSDQLNAIKNGMKYVTEENSLVYILHSDDLLTDKYVFEKAIKYFEEHDCEAILGDLDLINGNSENIGIQKIRNYVPGDDSLALQTLWLGRQLYIDFAFWKKKTFFDKVYINYLTWNMPYWLSINDENVSMMDVRKVDFKFIKYRIFEGNYINNEVGLLNVLNGELRTLTGLLKYFDIPMYKIQYFVFRILNKLNLNYKVIYKKRESNNKFKIVKFVINKRISDNDLMKYPYFKSILDFYKNKDNDKKCIIQNIEDSDVFLGSDMRKFNKLMLQGKLPDIYNEIFKHLAEGTAVFKTDKKSYDKLVNILKFMCVYHDVRIDIDEE